MRVAVLTEPGNFEFVERDRPDPAAEEVLVSMQQVGICGSDVHYYEHGHIGDNVVEQPHVLGHESAGVVEAVGDDVTDLAAGDRVALEPGIPCRRCDYCRRGEYNLCPDVTFMASPPDDGAFAEYVAWPADFVYELPETVSLQEGALCEPLSVGIHATRRGAVESGDSVVIFGAGPIGMVVMEAARVAGASEIIVVDVVDEKLDRARERGGDETINSARTDVRQAVDSLTDGEGVDVAFEASGAEPAVRETVDVVRRGGVVVLIGNPSDREIPFDVLDVIGNQLDVRGSYRFANTYPVALDLLERGLVDVAGLIDFERPLSDVDAAFQQSMEPDVVKGMISIGDSS